MKIVINVAVAALLSIASAPAFAHGGGMGHMAGNMGSNTGGMSHQTVTGKIDGDHHNLMHRRYTKTTKTIRKTRFTRLEKLKLLKLLKMRHLHGNSGTRKVGFDISRVSAN
jgi:hypothetical protein